MAKDYITLPLESLNGGMWAENRIISRFEAWIDIIKLAHDQRTPNGVSDGTVKTSIRALSVRWKWSEKKVRTYLSYLIKTGHISNVEGRSSTTFVVNEYSKFISKGTARGTAKGTDKRLSNNALQCEGAQQGAQQRAQVDVNNTSISINAKAKNIFTEHFLSVFGEAYYWEAKDAVNMDRLVKKLTNSRKERSLSVDDESVLKALSVFLGTIKDAWVLKNFSVSIINSKYNELVSQAKEAVKKGMDVGIKLDSSNPKKYDKSKLW